MSVDLAQLLQSTQGMLLAGFAVFLRVGATMALLPAFGEQILPMRLRLALGLCFTLIVLPAVTPALTDPLRGAMLSWLPGEIGIGLAIGLALRGFVFALQISGTMIAQAISLAQLFGGTAGEPQPAVGQLLLFAGLALALKSGLALRTTEFLIQSYAAMPPGHWPNADLLRGWEVAGVARAFALAFSIAAPFVIAGLIYNIALGAINRAMPQLMVAFVGAPALTAGGLALLAIAIPTGLIIWHQALLGFFAHPFTVR